MTDDQTTAHTLAFCFALLALYPDKQEKLYQDIKHTMATLNGYPVILCIYWALYPADAEAS